MALTPTVTVDSTEVGVEKAAYRRRCSCGLFPEE
jgi:hypothetical protein